MSDKLKRQYTRGAMFSLCLALSTTGTALAADGCVNDTSVQVCVTSAALTGAPWEGEGSDQRAVTVSVSLKITNTTDYPLAVAMGGGGWGSWSLTPQNAEAITNQGQWGVTGLSACASFSGCSLTTIASHVAAIAQIRYRGVLSTNGLPLVQIASKASFSGTLLLVDRGKSRQISLALENFTFGNALTGAR